MSVFGFPGTVMWLLGIEPRSSAGAGALNHWAISPLPLLSISNLKIRTVTLKWVTVGSKFLPSSLLLTKRRKPKSEQPALLRFVPSETHAFVVGWGGKVIKWITSFLLVTRRAAVCTLPCAGLFLLHGALLPFCFLSWALTRWSCPILDSQPLCGEPKGASCLYQVPRLKYFVRAVETDEKVVPRTNMIWGPAHSPSSPPSHWVQLERAPMFLPPGLY